MSGIDSARLSYRLAGGKSELRVIGEAYATALRDASQSISNGASEKASTDRPVQRGAVQLHFDRSDRDRRARPNLDRLAATPHDGGHVEDRLGRFELLQ